MIPRYRRQQQRRWLRNQKRQHVRVNISDGGSAGVFMGSGHLQQRRWRRQSKTGPLTQRQ